MIRLSLLVPREILYEVSATALQAKKLGYTHAGGGNWRKGKSGPVIARSKGGKLVPVNAPDSPDKKRRTKKAPKKKGARGADTIRQIRKTAGEALVKSLKTEWSSVEEVREAVDKLSVTALATPNLSSQRKVDTGMPEEMYDEKTPAEARALRRAAIDYMDSIKAAVKKSPLNTVDEMKLYASFGNENARDALDTLRKFKAKGVKINSIESGKETNYYDRSLHLRFAKEHDLKSIDSTKNLQLSRIQTEKWRSQMTTAEVNRFGKDQEMWQGSGVYYNPRKEQIFKDINRLTRKYGAPDTGVKTMYRGMVVEDYDAPEFLSNFEIGSTIISPPSGYTSNHKVARSFGYGGDIGVRHVVVFNLKAASGNVKGIHLASTYRRTPTGKSRIKDSGNITERESIIPSTLGQKVSDVQIDLIAKIDSWDDEPVYQFVTNISLVQNSEPTKEKTMYEAKKPQLRRTGKSTAKKLLIKYMGGGIRGPEQKNVLDKYLGGKLGGRVNQK